MKTASHSNTNESPVKSSFSTEKTSYTLWDENTPWGKKRMSRSYYRQKR